MDPRRSESRQSRSRPASSLSMRAPSALSFASSSHGHGSALPPKTPKASAARYGGLAEKDLQKVSAAVAHQSSLSGRAETLFAEPRFRSPAVFEQRPRPPDSALQSLQI